MGSRTAALAVVAAAAGLIAPAARAEPPEPTFIQIVQPAEGECVRSLVPLVISNEMLDEGLDIFDAAVEAAVKG